MDKQRFNVFGKLYDIHRSAGGWEAFSVGADGKRGLAGFEIPSFIEDGELEQFLFDLFHESATPNNGEVRRLK